MKKIVALVLSMVMVLGLATVASAAQSVTTYENMNAKYANGTVYSDGLNIDLKVTEGKAPVYSKVDGSLTTDGAIEFAVIGVDGVFGADKYVLASSLADLTNPADVVLYKDAASKVAVFYLKAVASETYKDGVVFANFGEDCGEVVFADYDATKTYYTVKGDLAADATIYVADAVAGTQRLKVAGEYVMVKAAGVDKSATVKHTAIYTTKNGVVEAIECGACGLKAVKVANALSMAKDADVVANETVWYWPAGVVADTATDKVESAQTFDAGIAMYVGMSVMAAAGSAVVLKKKD